MWTIWSNQFRICLQHRSVFILTFSYFIFTARRAPFTVGVNFDSNELTDDAVVDAMAATSEASEFPGGITGFKLIYFQVAC